MGRHVNSLSLNRSIEAVYIYKLSILYSGFLHPAMLCLFQRGFLLFFVHYACNTILTHFPFLMLMNRTWRYFWISKWRKLGKAWNFTQILDHILIRDTDNEIYWASPPLPPSPFLFTEIHNMSVLKACWRKALNKIIFIVSIHCTTAIWSDTWMTHCQSVDANRVGTNLIVLVSRIE